MDAKKIGTLISSLRKEKGLSQKEFGDILGVSPKTISKWECAKGLPDISMLKTVADVFEITTDELLEGNIKEKVSNENNTNKKKLLFIGIILFVIVISSVIYIMINKDNKEE